MPLGPRVESIPTRPVLIYDGTCELCRAWAHRWQTQNGGGAECLPAESARVRERFPELSPRALATAVHLIRTDGTVSSGAEAILEAQARGKARTWPWRIYRRYPRFSRMAEWAYRWVARHRRLLSRLAGSPSGTP